MADAAVSFLLENLTQQLVVHSLINVLNFGSKLEKEIQDVELNLRVWRSALKELCATESGISAHNLIRDVRDLVFRLEDILETFLIMAQLRKGRKIKVIITVLGYGLDIYIKSLKELSLEAKEINTRMENILAILTRLNALRTSENEEDRSSSLAKEDGKWLRHPIIHEREEYIIGMEEHIQDLKSLIVGKHHRVICICGISGIGKTTIARLLYMNHNIQIHFEGLAWINIGQKFSIGKVFRDILNQLIPGQMDEIMHMSDVEVARQLHKVQKDKKCLVVLDGMGSIDEWKFLCLACPSENTHSKILVTTQIRDVAAYVAGYDRYGIIHEMNSLTTEQSWKLFTKIAFSSDLPEVHLWKEKIGKQICSRCECIPSAIIAVGKILATKHTLREWEMVLQDMESGHPAEQIGIAQPVSVLSYDCLPYDLKPCFLYLGQFPKGFKIDVEHLYLMWMAMGMISSDGCQDNETMMNIADRYLGELVKRKMVEVKEEETPLLTIYRSCWIHEQLRDYCLLKGEEYFFEVLDLGLGNQIEAYSSSSSSSSNPTRHLALHLSKQDDGSSVLFPNITAKHLRSLLLVHPHDLEIMLEWPQELSDLTKFKMLRVLNFEQFDFGVRNLPRGLTELIHLRYLSFKGCILKKLPSSISDLSFLWFLDLRVKGSSQMIIPNVLSKMEKLRHLYLPLKFKTPNNKKLRLCKLKELEILMNFDSRVCNIADLYKMKKLLHLSATVEENPEDLEKIVQRLNMTSVDAILLHPSVKVKDFDCYTEERHSVFRKLLNCQVLQTLHMDGHIGRIPPYHKITSSLIEIVLIGSQLEEDPMRALEKLPKLQVLVLQDDAFVGEKMNCSASGFKELKRLELLTLHFLETWEVVDDTAMPKLTILAVKNCRKLQMVPHGLSSRVPSVTFENDN